MSVKKSPNISRNISHKFHCVFADCLRFCGVALKINEVTIAPVIDLITRLFFAQIFFASGIIKLNNFDTALYLAQYEYPVSWLNYKTAAYLGVAIEVIAPIFLALGLMTRFAALPLLILAILAQTVYTQINIHIFWIIFLAWYVICGSDSFSLDHMLRGLKDSATPFSRSISKIFHFLTQYIAPIYQFTIRFWIASVLYIAGHESTYATQFADYLMFMQYQHQVSVLVSSHAEFFVGLISSFCAILIAVGFTTRIQSLIVLLALSVITINAPANNAQEFEFIFWFMLLSSFAATGAGKLSIDHLIRNHLSKKFPELEGDIREIPKEEIAKLPHVLIVGAGFGGIAAARKLRRTVCRVTLIDKNNYHLFQPLLYQVATASLSPADVAVPIRSLFRDQNNIQVILGEVNGVDKKNKTLKIKNKKPIKFDYLILATGAQHSYFGRDEWSEFAPGLKKIEDAVKSRGLLLRAFEAAENSDSETQKKKLMSFVIVGGGPTGVELAGALAELAHHGMKNEFRNINPADAKIYLIESGDRVLKTMPEKLSFYTKKTLESLGVTVLNGERVSEISKDGVKIGDKKIPAANVFWAAGVQASPAAKWLKLEEDRTGRVIVNQDLSVPGNKNIFAIGDTAAAKLWEGNYIPGLAPAAKQGGKFVAKLISNRIDGKNDKRKFHYTHYGNLATIGRKAAVADFGFIRIIGAPAWWLWGLIHVSFLTGTRNRLSVIIEWFWAYATFKRSTRLITGDDS